MSAFNEDDAFNNALDATRSEEEKRNARDTTTEAQFQDALENTRNIPEPVDEGAKINQAEGASWLLRLRVNLRTDIPGKLQLLEQELGVGEDGMPNAATAKIGKQERLILREPGEKGFKVFDPNLGQGWKSILMDVPKDWLLDMVGDAIESVPGAVGGAAGAVAGAGTPLTPIGGGMLLGAVGDMWGTQARKTIDDVVNSPDTTKSPDLTARAADNVGAGMVAEGVGQLIAQPLAKGVARQLDPRGPARVIRKFPEEAEGMIGKGPRAQQVADGRAAEASVSKAATGSDEVAENLDLSFGQLTQSTRAMQEETKGAIDTVKGNISRQQEVVDKALTNVITAVAKVEKPGAVRVAKRIGDIFQEIPEKLRPNIFQSIVAYKKNPMAVIKRIGHGDSYSDKEVGDMFRALKKMGLKETAAQLKGLVLRTYIDRGPAVLARKSKQNMSRLKAIFEDEPGAFIQWQQIVKAIERVSGGLDRPKTGGEWAAEVVSWMAQGAAPGATRVAKLALKLANKVVSVESMSETMLSRKGRQAIIDLMQARAKSDKKVAGQAVWRAVLQMARLQTNELLATRAEDKAKFDFDPAGRRAQ